jgi:hypothetical protein
LDKVPEGAMVMVSARLTRLRLSRRHDLAGKTKGRAEPSTCVLLCGPDAVADYEAELSGRSDRSARGLWGFLVMATQAVFGHL